MLDKTPKEPHLIFRVLNFIFSAVSDNYSLLPVDRLLLLALAKHHGPKGIYPSTTTLCKELKISPTYVKLRINYLDTVKLIKVVRKHGVSHRYELLFLSTDPSTTVDLSIPVDLSTTVSGGGQLQLQDLSTTVDLIRIDNQFKESVQSVGASRASTLLNFSPNEENQILCSDLRLDLDSEVKRFKARYQGKSKNLQMAFGSWIKGSKPKKVKQEESKRSTGIDYTMERLKREAETGKPELKEPVSIVVPAVMPVACRSFKEQKRLFLEKQGAVKNGKRIEQDNGEPHHNGGENTSH